MNHSKIDIPGSRKPAGPVTIRQAKRGDASRLIAMITSLAGHHGDAATVTPATLDRDIFDASACTTALVAHCGGSLLGYAALNLITHLHFGRRVMDLAHLFVEDLHRGHGVGRQLIAASVEEARRQRCTRLTVGTHPENETAQAVYRSLGFRDAPVGGTRFQLDLPETGALPDGWV
ncbi:GNAT family N-acetyltransferase [Aliiruegeria haliotis]|nr:GNAT family N-acetyltransferase [Aliiruegeria haliotis]